MARDKDNKISDAKIVLKISKNNMEAVVTIKKDPSKKGSYEIKLEDIKQALKEKKVKYGVYSDTILQCHLDQKNSEFIVAKQDFSLELIKVRQTSFYFNTDKIDPEIKNRGKVLVEQLSGTAVYIKKNLFGKNVKQSTEYGSAFRCAAGTRFSKDRKKAVAGKTGFPCLSIEKKLYIHPVINVLEDADLKYGPLEDFANLNISGALTGAYPINAGNINAREIRSARIKAMGDVKSQIGITDAVIIAQGDVYASYVHNSSIETFGNIYIENEIIDSKIYCSGKIDSSKCRIITSNLYGKKGIELAGVGTERTKSCILVAGTEHHVIEKARIINLKIQEISLPLNNLKEKKERLENYSKKTFQKMVDLKIFYDRAKIKKQKLSLEFKKKKQSIKKANISNISNIAALIKNLDNRMSSALASLKKLNRIKQNCDKENKKLEKKIKQIEPSINRKIFDLQTDLFAFFEWARKQENNPQIKINGKVFAGTILKGVFSFLKVKKDKNNINVIEKQNSKNQFCFIEPK